VTQLVSWGVLFYGFAVVAPDITAETGWAESSVAGAFSVGLLVAGICAPSVAAALARHDPRRVLTAGSLLGGTGMLLFASAEHLAVLYAAWVVIGVAMAATLYEPAMAVVVALDPARRHRTLATITVAGGLASTVFAPVGGALVDHLGWRAALAVLGLGAAVGTAPLHALVLPAAPAVSAPPEPASPAVLATPGVGRLRTALLFEQAAVLATTAHLIGLLVDRGTTLAIAGAVLGVMGVGKVAGRLLLLAPAGRRSLPALAAVCNAVQLAGLAVPLLTIGAPALFLSAAIVGAASGATTVLRPLLIVELVGPGPFAAVSARLQRSTTVARSVAPFALGAGVTAFGWRPTWSVAIAAFGIAAQRYGRLHADQRQTPTTVEGRNIRPVDAQGV
jgi:predicted MFS family arabinose efflux permease